ncbi:GTP cyclohydrolase II RibA [Propylenella binzhouense]|uniref:GTP cyclohydrolase-2 n=1 Tax=Propylenella binzhouense TaxID=2555902 RepID=A0A964T854_9HYPH|nr:GTP cyclohydrolase II RibA [Propylenella binzhouense]MYZ50318.1 GTP cyclohydrolase II RibA [Propylenella binzhouense]
MTDSGGFDSGPEVRVERAVAELRAGRPVLLASDSGPLAVLALDATTPAVYDRFAALAGGGHALHLTRWRAELLDIPGAAGVLVPLAGLSHAEAVTIGYGPIAEAKAVLPGVGPATPASTAASELARLALLLPAVAVAPVAERAGSESGMVKLGADDLELARTGAGRRFEEVSRARVPLAEIGDTTFVVFRGGLAQRDQLAVIVGAPDLSGVVPVRLHSSCITGDLFGSLKCDCGDQLRDGLRALHERGGGILLYLDQEGRGTGIAAKMHAYGHQDAGLDTIEADAMLGFGPDGRGYDAAVAMLRGLGADRVDLLTNNPSKVEFLREAGIDVVNRTPIFGQVTPENRRYLRTKSERAGHLIEFGDDPGRDAAE